MSSSTVHTLLRNFIAEQEERTGKKPQAAKKKSVTKDTETSFPAASSTATAASSAPHSQINLPRDDEKDSFSDLPTELLQQIIGYLDVPQVANLRATKHRFANLCTPDLFKTGFSLRPQRDDMVRLAQACLVPDIAASIKQLTIYMGDMSLDQFLAGINSARYVAVPDKPLLPIHKLFNPHGVHCQRDILEAIFSQLPNLISISLTSYTSPFWQSYEDNKYSSGRERTRLHFEAIWDHMQEGCADFDRSHFLDSKKSITRYTDTLLAMLKLPNLLQVLEMDAFPIDCFSSSLSHFSAYDTEVAPEDIRVEEQIFQQMKQAISSVQTLEIGLTSSGNPTTLYTGAALGKALGEFIGSMKDLRSLSLDWRVEEDVNEDFAIAWDRTFFQLLFKNLEEMRLDNVESPRTVVSKFILKHKANLKRLHWAIPDLDEEELHPTADEDEPPSWRTIFTEFKDQLKKIECCELLDDRDEGHLYLKDWEPEHKSKYRMISPSMLLELFVQGKIPWPMKKDNPHRYKGWQPKYTTNIGEFATYSPESLADFYSEEWETDGEESSGSSMDEDDDDESDDSEDTDDYLAHGHVHHMMDLDEADEWEDEEDEVDALSGEAEFYDDIANMMEEELMWGDIPPAMAIYGMFGPPGAAEGEMDESLD